MVYGHYQNIFCLLFHIASVRESTLKMSESDVYKRQILMAKVGHRVERVNSLKTRLGLDTMLSEMRPKLKQ